MARHLDLDDLVAELAAAQHGAFTLSQLGPIWCDRRLAAERVKRREWERVVSGTYLLPAAADEWSVAAALCLHVPQAAVGFASAGAWWRLDGVPLAPIELVAPRSCAARHTLVRQTRDLAAWEVVLDRSEGCLRVTDPTRTIIDAAGMASADEVERMVESALRRGLASEARLRARARQLRRPGRRGPGRLLAVLDGRPSGGVADSDGEVVFLQLLRAAGIPAPVRQLRMGSTFFDLAWPEQRVLVELDGRSHRSQQRLQRDDRKQNVAVLAGWTVLRFTWDRVEHDLEAVLAEIRAALAWPMSA